MNTDQKPAGEAPDTHGRTITDRERLDWILANHYEFRNLYLRFGNTSADVRALMREAIDREILRRR